MKEYCGIEFGKQYNDVIALYRIPTSKDSKIHVKCAVCGLERDLLLYNMKKGIGTSHKGCIRASRKSDPTGDTLLLIWKDIRSRCMQPKHVSYPNYGGRGIKCHWDSIAAFREDMLESYLEACKHYDKPSIERIDVNGDYCKENCKWISLREQKYNTRRTRMIKASTDTEVLYFRTATEFGKDFLGKKQCGHLYSIIDNPVRSAYGWKLESVETIPEGSRLWCESTIEAHSTEK